MVGWEELSELSPRNSVTAKKKLTELGFEAAANASMECCEEEQSSPAQDDACQLWAA